MKSRLDSTKEGGPCLPYGDTGKAHVLVVVSYLPQGLTSDSFTTQIPSDHDAPGQRGRNLMAAQFNLAGITPTVYSLCTGDILVGGLVVMGVHWLGSS